MVSSNMPKKTKIFVGRLPENCRNDELRQLFLRFGAVTECDVMNRYGFVHMAREEDATAAIKALHNTNFKGATINVEQSTGKSRGGGPGGRRDDRRGPMRGGRMGRDGGRDGRPTPYNDRRGMVGGGYSDYGNRGGGDFGGRGGDYSGGYGDRGGYGQNVGNVGMGGYSSTAPGMTGGYGPNAGGVGGYGPTGASDYGRADYSRSADFSGRNDYGNCTGSNNRQFSRGGYPSQRLSASVQSGGGMAGGDFNRGVPSGADYGRTDNFAGGRAADPYNQRNDYDRTAAGPMRNGGAVATGGYNSGGYTEMGPMTGAPNYNTGAPSYTTGPGAQTDMFSRRPGNAVPSGGYPAVAGGYSEGYDRPEAYGLPRGGGRFPGPADAIPPRY